MEDNVVSICTTNYIEYAQAIFYCDKYGIPYDATSTKEYYYITFSW